MKMGETRDQTILPPTVILGEQERVIYIVGDVGFCGNHISPGGGGGGGSRSALIVFNQGKTPFSNGYISRTM